MYLAMIDITKFLNLDLITSEFIFIVICISKKIPKPVFGKPNNLLTSSTGEKRKYIMKGQH
jgi:hypothetical protein